jgi:hypothetical protein
MTNEIKITVSGGIVQAIENIPTGINIAVYDYDNHDSQDKDCYPCSIEEYEGEKALSEEEILNFIKANMKAWIKEEMKENETNDFTNRAIETISTFSENCRDFLTYNLQENN